MWSLRRYTDLYCLIYDIDTTTLAITASIAIDAFTVKTWRISDGCDCTVYLLIGLGLIIYPQKEGDRRDDTSQDQDGYESSI